MTSVNASCFLCFYNYMINQVFPLSCGLLLTFFRWFSSLTHSSLFCSRLISRLFSLLSFFRVEEAKEDAFSFRSNTDVWKGRGVMEWTPQTSYYWTLGAAAVLALTPIIGQRWFISNLGLIFIFLCLWLIFKTLINKVKVEPGNLPANLNVV